MQHPFRSGDTRAWPCRTRARTSLAAAAAVTALALAFGVQAQLTPAKDDLWELTIKTAIAGAANPAQTTRVCLAKGMVDENYIPRREECKVTESQRASHKLTYKMLCEGKDPMTIAGEITKSPKSYEGTMKMNAKRDGQDMDMTQTFSGKWVGECASSK